MNYIGNQQDNSMSFYQQALKYVVDASGDGKSYHNAPKNFDFKMQEGELYGFKTPDNENYYKTVFLKKLGIDQVLKPIISQFPIYGDIPPHIQEVSPDQIYKYTRLHNLQSMNGLNAFPKTDTPKRAGY